MSAFFVILIGLVLTVVLGRELDREDLFVALVAHLAHVASAFALILVYQDYYGYGDIFMYYDNGGLLARLLEIDFRRWFPQVVDLLLQRQPRLPIHLYTTGGETASMIALVGLLRYVLGDSLHAIGLLYATFASLGSLALFRAFRESLEPEHRRAAQISALFIPSVVFWSSGIFKEALAIGGLGLLVLGLVRALRDRWTHALPLLAAGAAGVGLSKPYIFLAVAAGAGGWYYFQRATAQAPDGVARVRPLALLAAFALVVVLIVVISELFPTFALTNLAARTAAVQEATLSNPGGSTYELGDPTDRTLAGQLAYAPLAILTSLYRPLLIEVTNALQLVTALEMSAFVVLTLLVLHRRGLRGTLAAITRRPVLVMCVGFVGVFSLGVGLATTNLGTLSRYRIPMMPFYLLVLVVLARRDAPGREERRAPPRSLALGRPVRPET